MRSGDNQLGKEIKGIYNQDLQAFKDEKVWENVHAIFRIEKTPYERLFIIAVYWNLFDNRALLGRVVERLYKYFFLQGFWRETGSQIYSKVFQGKKVWKSVHYQAIALKFHYLYIYL